MVVKIVSSILTAFRRSLNYQTINPFITDLGMQGDQCNAYMINIFTISGTAWRVIIVFIYGYGKMTCDTQSDTMVLLNLHMETTQSAYQVGVCI
ncbi:hypothetical protein BO79DRAFT_19724 [Aspergillus costaricaensis CBS 115574]|uniref:Uncharacterized protein n=1 Tax=Aspergillus costaricaensis CBS 115574 TaxID=1448317 RepID=A0ACD1IDZ6_9EURO|nr:hypothetical protein BO79DRAFT_19724 [Aspergillus costaricaensis CBS 115574]RAK88451.1 hypothetical protein BO79DRAFT_19724 [Aspergillus costaricaensis CBS 115574]